MIRDNFDHGFTDEVWGAATEQARRAMIDVATRGGVMSYSELVEQITSCVFEPHDTRLSQMLGEISSDEDERSRGLLTAVVVHRGDGKPGSGFFKLAKSLGRDVSDEDRCWVEELKKVYDVWQVRSRF